jgi:hypothetical protein
VVLLAGCLHVGSAALITFVLIPATNQVANEPTAAPDASSSPGALSGAPIDGIRCESEQVDTHYHAHLLLLQDGRQVALPAGIGISNAARCLYSLHTLHPTALGPISPSQRTPLLTSPRCAGGG